MDTVWFEYLKSVSTNECGAFIRRLIWFTVIYFNATCKVICFLSNHNIDYKQPQ